MPTHTRFSPRRRSLLAALALLGSGVASAQSLDDLARMATQALQTSNAGAGLSDQDIAGGLREALAQGTRRAVQQLGTTNGFWQNTRFRIPLPASLEQAQALLRGAGLGGQFDQLHLAMNRAAEQAVPVAADVFADAVSKLTLQDVRQILGGADDAATQYFKRSTQDTLMVKFKPIVSRVTAQSGLAQQYTQLRTAAGPLAGMVGATDLDSFVTQKALDGLFLRVADEEKSIRTNPAARSTELLKRVFGRT